MSLGIKALATEMGLQFNNPVEIHSDGSAAMSIANRIGSGKVRHVEVTQLWLQENARNKTIVVNKVGTDENLSDACTKEVDAVSSQKHLRRRCWHRNTQR